MEMDMTAVPVKNGDFNLKDYDAYSKQFSWGDMEKHFTWNETGKVNIAYEALDRHAEDPNKREKIALIYLSPDREEQLTFEQLSKASNKFANILKKYDIQKGDPVFLFMPKTPEFYIAFFGILKVGAIAGPIFEAFMEQAVRDRLQDSKAKLLITTPELLSRVPENELPALENIIIVDEMKDISNRYIHYIEEMESASEQFDIEWVDLEDGMLIHYISGSTGKPKGIYHVHHAMVQHYATAEWVLDLKQNDVFWCTADPGWITGTSYGIFAPWLHGVTNVIRGGESTPDDWYRTLEKYHVSVWYTIPTALRMLVSYGEEKVRNYHLTSLRHIMSVGEPLNPEIITWGVKVFGLRIHDTWLMTETGAQLITNLPSLEIRPGSMGKPIPGIEASIIDHEGNELPPNQMGNLAIKATWPSMMRKVWNNPHLFDSYFLEDWYVSGDRAYRDEDGYFWFQGRLDDVIKTAGERIGPFEIENKLTEHEAVADAGVTGKPHPELGEIVKAYITLNDGFEESIVLIEDIRQFVKNSLSTHAAPDEIEIRDTIPKTRSGKIMRHLLKSWN